MGASPQAIAAISRARSSSWIRPALDERPALPGLRGRLGPLAPLHPRRGDLVNRSCASAYRGSQLQSLADASQETLCAATVPISEPLDLRHKQHTRRETRSPNRDQLSSSDALLRNGLQYLPSPIDSLFAFIS